MPKTKTHAQHVTGMFGYWRHHIPFLQILLKPVYEVCRKASDFVWAERQKQAFESAITYLKMYAQLFVPQPQDTIILDILFIADYGTWGVYAKSAGYTRPVSFHCKRFPYSSNRYALFEKTAWTVCEAFRNLTFTVKDHCVLIRTPILCWNGSKPHLNSSTEFPWNLRYCIGNGFCNLSWKGLLCARVPLLGN